MAAEPPNASWHPAHMPNHHEDPSVKQQADATRATSSTADSSTHHDEAAGIEPESQPNTEAHDSEDGTNAWVSQAEDGGDARLAPEVLAQTREPATEPSPETPSDAQEPTDAIADAKPSNSTSQHSSSMSFARTVSHEPSFNDDDEGDWDLSRRDTDPFKFMAPSDRTNSFPVVPPISSTPQTPDQPLPSNQAMNVLEEAEKDVDNEQEQYSASPEDMRSTALNQSRPNRKHASSQSIGGDIKGPEALASDARYEEGLPLIQQSERYDQEGDGHEGAPGPLVNSFDEGGNTDDFFSQTHSTDADATDAPNQPLERKSTMQVLEAMKPDHKAPDLEETQEEAEEEFTPSNDGKHESGMADAKAEPETSTQDGSGVPQTGEDLAAKWQEAFADDDEDVDFLLEEPVTEGKEVDPAAFFGSDDEGFLDDADEPAPTALQPEHESVPLMGQDHGTGSYFPRNAAISRTASYMPSATPVGAASPHFAYNQPAPSAPFNTAPQYGSAPRPNQDAPKAQSFADKSKGGYHSPYDLPTDLVTTVVKPRKRSSMQQLPQAISTSLAPPPPPPRSASVHSHRPPHESLSPPGSSHGSQAPLHQNAPAPALRNKDSFFEELPVTAKPRSSSRTSHRTSSPAQHPSLTHLPHVPSPLMPPTAQQTVPPPAPLSAPLLQTPASHQSPAFANLVAPDRVSPYAPVQSQSSHMPVPSSSASRYSPAPASSTGGHIVPPAAPSSRYSPAPPAPRAHGSYGAVGTSNVPPAILPHQPRTSSPLTHYEVNQDKLAHSANGEPSHPERRTSSSFGPVLHRVSSLPPTREVDEEEDQDAQSRSLSAAHPPPAELRYSPVPPQSLAQQTPPHASYAKQSTLSPPKRGVSAYVPQAPPTTQPGFVPPLRAQTQSPSAVYGFKATPKSADSDRRPSSAHSPASPMMTKPSHTAFAPSTRPRGPSLTMNMIPPTDGREHDPLQRWKGVPIVTWGVGGTLITSFPNSVPRYGMNQAAPNIIRTPGELKVRNIKDIEPLQERLAKFPGPLKGKSKKKETIAWMNAGIETLEKDLPDVSFHSQLSLEAKRSIERLLLWKILKVFIEFDGALEGSPAVEKAVRDILSPGTITPTADDDALFPGSPGVGAEMTSITPMQVDAADAAAVEQVRHYLFRGDREKAVWACADKRLWGHAMLISHTVSSDLYKQVAQEFVRKEVNHPGHSNEPLAALYKVLSGNYDDCVDELVPVHARAGLQLVSTGSASGPTKATLDGLDKWRETLCLILSNRSVDDIRGLNALGGLLSSYGRAEAAHICFLFGRNASIFGGLDDPTANFVLLGSDHHQQSEQFAKETEALQLSEVYEYGLSLAGGVAAAAGTPHLAAYKLQHAMTLAEYGYRDKALQYCDAIATAMTSQTKRSLYHHLVLESAVEDFMTRLKQAPKGENHSWISKPSMNKVSDSMWNRFNKFVAGDDNENAGAAVNGGDVDSGPFGRIATTPTMSRSPSVNNFETYGGGSPSYPVNASKPMTAAASRYAPMAQSVSGGSNPYEPTAQYTPASRSSMERTSNEYSRSSHEPSYPGASPPSADNTYTPVAKPASEAGYQSDVGLATAPTLASPASIMPANYGDQRTGGLHSSASMPSFSMVSNSHAAGSATQGYQPPTYGYDPPQVTATPPEGESQETPVEDNTGGYQPPSYQPYSYEPPSYQPNPEPPADDNDEVSKPKKKSFMDDDDDDIPALRPQDKTKSEKDKENEEMFRKAAEEDAKRAAAQQSTKKGWGLSSWFGGSKKAEPPTPGEASPGKPIRAKLGEASSFVYDPELKRWVNKKPGAENVEVKKATPPPPRAPRSVTSTPPPVTGNPPPLISSNSAPPPTMPPRAASRAATPELSKPPSQESLGVSAPMTRSISNNSAAGPPSGPPSRPATSMSNASSIDDLLSAAPRRPGQKKPRKSGRYVDVMAK